MTDRVKSGSGHLHLLCGKIASGKSTLAEHLAQSEQSTIISEDQWLAELFKDELNSLQDYVTYSNRLRAAMKPHIVGLLQRGQTIVLDFAANTKGQRAWMRSIIEKSSCSHVLHFLNTADEICLERLKERNARGEHDFQATEEQFQQFSAYFTPPSEDEGFSIAIYCE